MKDGLTELNVRTATAVKGPKPKGRPRKTPWDCRIVLRRIYDFICPRSLHSLGENGREKIEGSPTNPGSPGRQSLKWVVTCGCWAGNADPFDKQLQLGFHSIPFYWVAGLVQPCRPRPPTTWLGAYLCGVWTCQSQSSLQLVALVTTGLFLCKLFPTRRTFGVTGRSVGRDGDELQWHLATESIH